MDYRGNPRPAKLTVMRVLATLAILLSDVALAHHAYGLGVEAAQAGCAATEPAKTEPSSETNAFRGSAGTWYTNADRTIWAGGQATDLSAGASGNKVPWLRPSGTDLTVSGRRLDGESAPLRAVIPCCFPNSFQASGLYLPTDGCWEITAKAGAHRLTFVTRVRAGSASN